jgi:Kef-type K+ transport system membrane component KefB
MHTAVLGEKESTVHAQALLLCKTLILFTALMLMFAKHFTSAQVAKRCGQTTARYSNSAEAWSERLQTGVVHAMREEVLGFMLMLVASWHNAAEKQINTTACVQSIAIPCTDRHVYTSSRYTYVLGYVCYTPWTRVAVVMFAVHVCCRTVCRHVWTAVCTRYTPLHV